MTTLILDTNWGCKIPRWAVCTIVTIVSALISLIYCTEFGLQALDAVDTYVNDVALFFTGSYALSDGIGWSANISVVWCETFAATSLYRCRDVANQVGWPSYLIYTIGFAVAQGLGIRVAYGSTPGIGAGVGFAELLHHAHEGRVIDFAPADDFGDRHLKETGIGDRLENGARELASPLDLVGVRANERGERAGSFHG